MVLSILAAVLLDFAIGDPYSFPHPVKLMGKIIAFEDKLARKIAKSKIGLRLAGFIIVVVNISLGFSIPYLLLKSIREYKVVYHIVNIYLIYTCIAAKSLEYEAMKVVQALKQGIDEGRQRLSYIVGRDTKNLTSEEIIRATVETVAENTSDGVIAPLFYIILLGAPGGLAYKFINTMDSMLGYMNEKYMDMGYFPAKTDDLFNFIPARLTALFMCIGSWGRFNVNNGFKIMIRDRKNHKSPNAVYPEAATAGLLGIQLGGDSYYHGELVHKKTMGDKLEDLKDYHVENTIEIMYRSEVVMLIIYYISKIV